MLSPGPFGERIARRAFLRGTAGLLGSAALAQLGDGGGGDLERPPRPHFAPRCRRVIFLFQAGAPSQLDLFDPKPALAAIDGQPMPASLTANATVNDQLAGRRLIAAGSPFRFRRCGESDLAISDLLPHTRAIVDRLCVVRSMHTDVLNHDPALTLMQTGHAAAGRPSFGAWASYGLGSANADLPAFTVLVSSGRAFTNPVNARLWGAGFLPGRCSHAAGDAWHAPGPRLKQAAFDRNRPPRRTRRSFKARPCPGGRISQPV